MYYSDELIAEVRSRVDIVSVLSRFLSLQKKGANYVCCCPFHNEKTPSFSVNQTRQIYKCFGCGVGGNVITFLQKYENMTFSEAMEYLAPLAGVTLPERDNSEEAKMRTNKKLRLYEANKHAANFFFRVLWDEKYGGPGMEYLKKRGLTDETIKHFSLGYAPTNARGVIDYCRKQGVTDQEMIDAGIAAFSEKNGLYCKFWNRVIFPIQDDRGKVLGFGGRVMGDGEPKYLNSQETDIFNKRRNLYGFNFAKASRKDRFILCEGYMDVISLHQAGFTEAVASLGTAFTSEQARILQRYSPNVYLSYDSDGAGTKAAMRAIEILRQYKVTGRIINMKPYKDPDEFIKGLGAEEFEKRMENAEDSLLFQVHTTEKNFNTEDYAEKTKFHHEIAQFLAQMEDPLERDNYLEAVSKEYGINKEHLKEAVGKAALALADKREWEEARTTGPKKAGKADYMMQNEQLILTFLLEEPTLYAQIRQYISEEDFSTELYRDVAKTVFESLREGKTPDPAAIISHYEDPDDQSNVCAVFTTQIEDLSGKEEKERAIADILYKIKKNSYEMHAKTRGSSMEDINKDLQEKQELEKLKKIVIRL